MGSYFGVVGVIIGVPIFAILISITKEWLEKKLSKKEIPTSTSEYYTDPDYSDAEKHKSLTRIMSDTVLSAISKGIAEIADKIIRRAKAECDIPSDDISVVVVKVKREICNW